MVIVVYFLMFILFSWLISKLVWVNRQIRDTDSLIYKRIYDVAPWLLVFLKYLTPLLILYFTFNSVIAIVFLTKEVTNKLI